AAVAFLRSRPEIAPTKIGLLGRSEGGWVTTLAASRDPRIAFVIMSSGCAIRPLEETLYSTKKMLEESGDSPSRIDRVLKLKTAIWEFDRHVGDGKETAADLRSERATLIKQLDDFRQGKPYPFPPVLDPDIDDHRKFAAIAKMMFYDPQP